MAKNGPFDVHSTFVIMNGAGYFSGGGSYPHFSKRGKIWNSKSAVHSHLVLANGPSSARSYGIDTELVEIEMTPTVISRRYIHEVSAELRAKAKMREEKRKTARDKSYKTDRANRLAQLLKEYSVDEITAAMKVK